MLSRNPSYRWKRRIDTELSSRGANAPHISTNAVGSRESCEVQGRGVLALALLPLPGALVAPSILIIVGHQPVGTHEVQEDVAALACIVEQSKFIDTSRLRLAIR